MTLVFPEAECVGKSMQLWSVASSRTTGCILKAKIHFGTRLLTRLISTATHGTYWEITAIICNLLSQCHWKNVERWDQVRPGKTRWDQVRSLRPLPQFPQFLQVPLEFWKVPQAVEVLALKQDNVVHRCLEGIKAQGNGIREKINKFHNVSSFYKFLLWISINCIWLLEIVNHVFLHIVTMFYYFHYFVCFFSILRPVCVSFFFETTFFQFGPKQQESMRKANPYKCTVRWCAI